MCKALHLTALSAVLCATGAMAQVVAGPHSTPFNLRGLTGNDTWLISNGYCNLRGCWAGFAFRTIVVDRVIKVRWTGVSNELLLSINIVADGDGSFAANWSRRYGVGERTFDLIKFGSADFSGSEGNAPCGTAYVCPAAYYRNRVDASKIAPTASPALAMAGSGDTVVGETGALLSRLAFASADPLELSYTESEQLEFESRVTRSSGGDYTYTYSVFNRTDADIDFSWLAAALTGTAPAMGSAARSFVSALAPMAVTSDALVAINPFDPAQMAGGAVDLLRPVPEPGTWAMLLAGIGAIGWRLRQRRTTAGD